MSADDRKPSAYRLPISGVLRLKFADFNAFANRLAAYISEHGIFIPTEQPKAAGTLLALEITLQNGERVLEAEGEVIWTRRSQDPKNPMGMAFRFLHLGEKSRKFVAHVARINRDKGIPPAVLVEGEKSKGAGTESPQTNFVEKAALVEGVSEGPIIGIDLGTTNSAAAVVEGDQAKMIPSEQGKLIMPSVVALTDKGKILVGQPAKDQLLINPRQTIFGVKRFMGRNFRSPYVREAVNRFPYAIKAGDQDEVLVTLGDKDYPVPEIGAFILGSLRENAEGLLQSPITDAVITVPAYYTENQRQATKDAAKLAGLNVKLLLNEPTAAALDYGYNKEFEKRVLVYDLGGGTFDVSILEINSNVFEVKGTGGDSFLGGMDFDLRLIDYVVQEFEAKEKVSLKENPIALQRVAFAVENAKMQLSFEEEVELQIPFLVERKKKPVDLKMRLSRQKLNELTADLVDRTLEICEKTIHSMGVMPTDIDDVLLVGGQTRMPLLRERIQEYFGREPRKGVHPEETVALGAALLAGSLNRIDGPMLLDVLSLPIGIELPGGKFKSIFNKFAPMPSRKTYEFEDFISAGQLIHPHGRLAIFQGESEAVRDNEYLGDIDISFRGATHNLTEVRLDFDLNREGILLIRATHRQTGDTVTVNLQLQARPQTPEAPVEKPAESRGFFKKLFRPY